VTLAVTLVQISLIVIKIQLNLKILKNKPLIVLQLNMKTKMAIVKIVWLTALHVTQEHNVLLVKVF
jgi:hypothetical protein